MLNHYTTSDVTGSTDLTSTVDREISPSTSSVYLAPATHECPIKWPEMNISEFEASEIAKQLQKNLTVSAKETSAYVRKLTSANDERKSSAVMGWVGILCVILPIVLLLLSDCRAIISHAKCRVCNVYNDQHSNSNRCTIPLEEMHTR
ncbi:hypothetical protein DPMN_156655 [Dreissena polymorpha]|uniref:Uncharacterized protein n=1 Tax=Dreissena polymorpha TaxID=45954 RepID=A0A9D4JCK1_DREPO|nr:hypothetical protein DPMN_156655 [Dreissena polymorpha]